MTVSKAYGTALYTLAREDDLSEIIADQLLEAEDCFRREPDFMTLLSTPAIAKAERCRMVERCFSGHVHPYVLNFLKLLTERGLIRQLSGCCRVFRTHYDQDHNILRGMAVTALPLPAAQRQRLETCIARRTGKVVRLCFQVDPSLLGGIRLDFDDRRIDGTLRRHLQELGNRIKNSVF